MKKNNLLFNYQMLILHSKR